MCVCYARYVDLTTQTKLENREHKVNRTYPMSQNKINVKSYLPAQSNNYPKAFIVIL